MYLPQTSHFALSLELHNTVGSDSKYQLNHQPKVNFDLFVSMNKLQINARNAIPKAGKSCHRSICQGAVLVRLSLKLLLNPYEPILDSFATVAVLREKL